VIRYHYVTLCISVSACTFQANYLTAPYTHDEQATKIKLCANFSITVNSLRPRQQIYWILCVLKSIQHHVRNGLNSSPASFKGWSPIPVIDLMPPVLLPIVSVNCVIRVHARSQARVMAATAHARDYRFQFHSVYRRKSAFLARSQNCEKQLMASSCLSVSMEEHASHRTDFHEI